MESVYNFSQKEIIAFALVFVRLSAFFATMPVFGVQNVPPSVKALLSLIVTFVVFPTVGFKSMTTDPESMSIVLLVIKEAFVGLAFGFLTRSFFVALTMAGQLISVSLGISSAQLYNPALGETSAAFDQFYSMLAALFFLAVDGHHLLLSGIVDTYKIVSLGQLTVSFEGLQGTANLVSTVMEISLKAASPVVVAILFVNVAMALIGRAVPQINILITSLPVNTLIGLFVIIFTLPFLMWEMRDILGITQTEVMRLMKSL